MLRAHGSGTYASLRALSPHPEGPVEELQRGVADVFVQLRPVHAGGVVAGFRIVVASNLVALIVENLVVGLAGQHVELSLRNILCRKGRVVLGWRRGVAGSDDEVG